MKVTLYMQPSMAIHVVRVINPSTENAQSQRREKRRSPSTSESDTDSESDMGDLHQDSVDFNPEADDGVVGGVPHQAHELCS